MLCFLYCVDLEEAEVFACSGNIFYSKGDILDMWIYLIFLLCKTVYLLNTSESILHKNLSCSLPTLIKLGLMYLLCVLSSEHQQSTSWKLGLKLGDIIHGKTNIPLESHYTIHHNLKSVEEKEGGGRQKGFGSSPQITISEKAVCTLIKGRVFDNWN